MFSPPRVAASRNRRTAQHRRLVLVDIENVVGGAVTTAAAAASARQLLEARIPLQPTDIVVIGTSHIGLLHVGFQWPGRRYVVGSGPDGADLALLEVFEEDVARRFGEVVLVSGDGIFSEAVAALGTQGVKVVVVCPHDALSKRLAMAAAQTMTFPRGRMTDHHGDAA